ncbi:MAG TPA: preprotein translocase subunit TatC [Phycisphaeraceae bacterium]|nr:preprotein translocase subunit TatC [Phycisphaeraceae bacterium]
MPEAERNNFNNMSFGDHLEELRRRLFICVIAPIPFIIIGFIFGQPLIEWLWQPCQRVLESHGLPSQMQVLSPMEAFVIWMKVSVILGLICTSPVIVYQVWAFVAPGLYDNERRFAFFLVPLSVVLVILGLVFLYTVLIPISMNFFVSFGAGFKPTDRIVEVQPNTEDILQIPIVGEDPPDPVVGQLYFKIPENQLRIFTGERVLVTPFSVKTLLAQQIQLNKYINLVMVLSLTFPLAFQLPVIMLLLGWSGLVEVDMFRKVRKYALFICAVAGAVFTPADPWSMLALWVPLYALYEFGILLIHFFPAKKISEGKILRDILPRKNDDE